MKRAGGLKRKMGLTFGISQGSHLLILKIHSGSPANNLSQLRQMSLTCIGV